MQLSDLLGKFRSNVSANAPKSAHEPMSISEAKELKDVVVSLLSAIVGARQSLDAASAELAKAYWADPLLRSLPVPAFSIPEVTVHLKFAVVDLGTAGKEKTPAMRVIVDGPSLNNLPVHLVSQLEMKIAPQSVRIYQSDGGEIVLSQV